jgi:tripartite-type tricarboxylate transporter receptor subunit TctC
MKLSRRQFWHLAAGAAALPMMARIARAEAYPIRPITMIVPFAAGGPTDALARVLAERMRRALGQSIIVENVGGADGSIGTGRAARANPDGHTIEMGFLGTHVLNGALYSLPYDVVSDFTPISPLVMFPEILLARKNMPARDLRELIVWLKANPGQASAGVTTAGVRLVTEFFQQQTGTKLNFVPYRGTAPAVQDLVAGQIDLLFAPPDALPQVAAGSIKAYVVTSAARLAIAPAIPTVAEAGLPNLAYVAWFALFAPKGTAKDIVGTLDAAVVEALADPMVQSRLVDLGFEVFPRDQQTPEALGVLVKSEAAKWWPMIKELGIKGE